MTKIQKFAMNYGMVLGLLLVSISLLMYATGIGQKESYLPVFLNSIIPIAFITYSIMQFKNIINSGFISYKESLKLGTTVSFFSSLIISFYSYIDMTYIHPEMLVEMIETVKRQMIIDNPEISDEELEVGLGMIRKISKPHWLIIIQVLSVTFMGFLYSLVISIFVKNENKITN